MDFEKFKLLNDLFNGVDTNSIQNVKICKVKLGDNKKVNRIICFTKELLE